MARTSDVIEIKGSPAKLLGGLAAGVMMTTASAAIAFDWLPVAGRSVGLGRSIVGWFCLVFFGLCTATALWRLLTARRTVVTITPAGIKDIRIPIDFVPWSSVRDISTMKIKRRRFIVLAVEPSVEARLALAPIANWSLGLSRMLGVDGLCVSAIGLKINHEALFKACLEYWRAAHGPR